MGSRWGPGGVLVLALGGCDGETSPEPPMPDGCAVGEVADGCVPPGVLAERCAQGFAPTAEHGCEPILPSAACEAGTMALPGETSCRPVAPCSDVEAATDYVDAAYAGGASDGSAARPWTNIQDAIDADGAVIAIAAGSYDAVSIVGKRVELAGRCPSEVEIAGLVMNDATGSAIRKLAIQGQGILVSASTDVTLDALWIHDTPSAAVRVVDTVGFASVAIVGSLIENATLVGVQAVNTRVTVTDSEIRDAQPDALDGFGNGIAVQLEGASGEAALVLTGSRIERTHHAGVLTLGGTLDIAATYIADTQPRPTDLERGRGIVVEHNTDLVRAAVTLRQSVVEKNYDVGLLAVGADVVVEDSVLALTKPNAATGEFGRGLDVESSDAGPEGTAVVRRSLALDNQQSGVAFFGVDFEIEAVRVLQRDAALLARGIAVQQLDGAARRSSGSIRDVHIENAAMAGLYVSGTDVVIDNAAVLGVVTDTNGEYGDGIAVTSDRGDATTVDVTRALFVDLARAGASCFSATLSLSTATFQCASIDIVTQRYWDPEPRLLDLGNNLCGCPAATEACQALDADLEPPTPL